MARPALDPSLDRAQRLSVAYLAAQAVLGVALWATWASADVVRSWFELMSVRHAVMDAFVFADLVIGVGGSALSAWGIATVRSWTVPVLAFTAGGLTYPTLYLIGWVSFAGTGALNLATMVPVSTFTCLITYHTWKRSRAVTG